MSYLLLSSLPMAISIYFLSKELAMRLNIYIGKLLGWVMSAEDAADEMGVKKSERKEFYATFNATQVKSITFYF